MTKIVAGLLAAASLVGTLAVTAAPTTADAQPYGYGRGYYGHRHYGPYRHYGYRPYYHHRFYRHGYYR